MNIRLLGKFEVSRDGKVIAITSRPAQSLFAYLILNAGTSHRREKLAGLLWPDSLEETARENLRHALWRLRKALEAASSTRFLHADDLTIKFEDSSDYSFDVAELEKLNETASSDELMTILSEYEGELLPGFYDEWVLSEREHLHSISEHHLARLMSLLQDEKRWLDVLEWAERWIRLRQKPEPAYRALMMAHAAKGDMSKVAAVYERCVKGLKEFGFEPSEQTRALYERLKAGKETLKTVSNVPVNEKREELPKTNLPTPLTSFIGREREIEEVKHLLSSTRLLTLTGTGGIGKTRLAIQAAHDLLRLYKDGVWWVELAPLTDEALVPQAVAQVLGVRESPRLTLIESIKNFLREKQALLILDNCEHMIAVCARLANDLLTQCAHLRILTTSREALGIMGETSVQVPALSFPRLAHLSQLQNLEEFESIQLFAERAAAARPDLALTEQNVFTVTQICHRLDGIPLALELAAARVKVLSLEQIATRLNDRFNLLREGNRTALPRHQTLRALIDWSYELLSEPERILFRRLSTFTGGWTLESAESICADGKLLKAEVLDVLSHLVDKSLVVVVNQIGTTRYNMLETIRNYGQEKLPETGEEDEIYSRHFEYFLQFVKQAEMEVYAAEQNKWLASIDAEYSNLRAALAWATKNDPIRALYLATSLGQYYQVRGFWDEGRKTIQVSLKGAQEAPKALQASGLYWIGRLTFRQGDLQQALEPVQTSVVLWRELGEKLGLARSLDLLGSIYSTRGDLAGAEPLHIEGLSLSREIDEKREIATVLCNLGVNAARQGDYQAAQGRFEESAALFRDLNDNWRLAWVLNNQGGIAEEQGDYSAAGRFYKECIRVSKEIGENLIRVYALIGTADIFLLQNDQIMARRYYRESLMISRETGEMRMITACLTGFAMIAARFGDPRGAVTLFAASFGMHETLGIGYTDKEKAKIESDLSLIHERLDIEVFQSAWAEGQTMSKEQAIDFALEKAESPNGA